MLVSQPSHQCSFAIGDDGEFQKEMVNFATLWVQRYICFFEKKTTRATKQQARKQMRSSRGGDAQLSKQAILCSSSSSSSYFAPNNKPPRVTRCPVLHCPPPSPLWPAAKFETPTEPKRTRAMATGQFG